MSARKTERLLNLVICLLATRRYLSADQIRRTVAGYEDLGDEAFKRKFERDKEDLRDLGIPLETGSDSPFDDEPGYRIRRDDYSLPDIEFEPAELAVLGVAVFLSLFLLWVPIVGALVAGFVLAAFLRRR